MKAILFLMLTVAGYSQVAPFAFMKSGAASTLNNELVAYWKMDEASGTRSDSKSTNHLTDNNTVTQAVGKVGYAGQYATANLEYLSIADNAALSMGAGVTMTIACWVYLDSKLSYMGLVSKWSAGDVEYLLDYDVSVDRFIFFTQKLDNSGSINVIANTFGSPSISTWYFIVCRYNGTAINISVNNGTVDSAAFAFDIRDGTAALELGRLAAANYYSGRIDEVGIWKRALTAAEITELYNSGSGKAYPF